MLTQEYDRGNLSCRVGVIGVARRITNREWSARVRLQGEEKTVQACSEVEDDVLVRLGKAQISERKKKAYEKELACRSKAYANSAANSYTR